MVLNKIKSLFSYVILFVRTRKSWVIPKKNKVLIYDGVNAAQFTKYFPNRSPEILYIRGEQVNIWMLFLSFFRRGKRKVAYEDCYIEHVCPSLIITFIDNNINFYTISKRHPNLKTLFVQNGYRAYYLDVFHILDKIKSKDLDKFKVDFMLTFGVVSGNHYANYINGSIIPLGSFKNNMIQPCLNSSKPNLMVFISQWNKNGFYINEDYWSMESFSGQSEAIVIQSLLKYAKLNNKKFMIVPRKTKDSPLRIEEEAYYNKLLGKDGQFLDPEGQYSSYHAIDLAEVVVSLDSTLGYESIVRGNKTALFSIRSESTGLKGFNYGWPGNFQNEGPFWINQYNSESFDRVLDYLFNVDKSQWKKDIEESDFSSIMNYDFDNSTFKEIVDKETNVI